MRQPPFPKSARALAATAERNRFKDCAFSWCLTYIDDGHAWGEPLFCHSKVRGTYIICCA